MGAMVCVASGIGCSAGDQFTTEELNTLRPYRVAPSLMLPGDGSNIYADSVPAAQLGKKFFFETRFGGALGPDNDGATNGSLGVAGATGKTACASCHELDRGGTDHRSQPGNLSLGAGYTGRNAPAVINAAFSPIWQFWDGRKDSLWSQALGPVESAVEANSTRLQVAHVIYDNYKSDYENVVGAGSLPPLDDATRFPPIGKPGDPAYAAMAPADQDAVTRVFVNFAKTIAAYERQVTSLNFTSSPFDAYMAGNETQMDPAAIRGAKLFVGKAACIECHRGPMFTDFQFHNIGVPQQGDHVVDPDDGRLSGIAKIMADVATGDNFTRSGDYSDEKSDVVSGLLPTDPTALATAQAALDGQFKTPTLRNVAKTAPYMHDGVYADLWDVVNHYNFGGETGHYAGTKSTTIQPLLLSNEEVGDLVEFLESLSDGDPAPSTNFPEGLIFPPMLPP